MLCSAKERLFLRVVGDQAARQRRRISDEAWSTASSANRAFRVSLTFVNVLAPGGCLAILAPQIPLETLRQVQRGKETNTNDTQQTCN